MATDISTFKSALTYGGARPSLFAVSISQPQAMSGISIPTMSSQCSVSAIPALTVTPIERQYFGRTVKIPGDLVFADLTTTIINTEKFNVRNEIEKWMEIINSTVENKSKSDADFGTGTAMLMQYGKDGEPVQGYRFIDCWPTTLSEIALSYDTASDIEQFDVTWAYNYYETVVGSTGRTDQT